MNDYAKWEAQKAELDRSMDEIQRQICAARTRTQQRQLERQFNALAKKRQRMSNFLDWVDGRV